jgi:PTS system fructose-specific IIA component
MAMAMAIDDVLQEECIILNSSAKTKEDIIEQLTDILFNSGALSDKALFLKDVWAREALGSTGFENHIAIPHGKSAAVLKTRIAIGRVKETIPWETIDGTQVKLVILFAVKTTDSDANHIKILSKISMALGDDDVVYDILHLPTGTELYHLLVAHSTN